MQPPIGNLFSSRLIAPGLLVTYTRDGRRGFNMINVIKIVGEVALAKINWKIKIMMTSTETTTKAMSTAIAPSKRKGKHASSTQNRRMVWEGIVWPLILQVNRSYFTLDEYHAKRDTFCATYNIPQPRVAGGFVSLLVKGILTRENKIYSIHYRLIPYMRKRANLEYGLVMREINSKR